VNTRALSPRRVWLLATVLLLLTFAAGALAGAAWERFQRRSRHEASRDEHHIGEMLKHRYGVNDDQARRIEAIVQKRRPRVDSLMATVAPQVRAAFDSTNQEIRAILTPGQRAKFDRDQARRRHRWPGPLPPGPSSRR